jgi:RHS repeat-associated protein
VSDAQRVLVRDYGSVLAGVSANPAASVSASGRVVRYIGSSRVLVRAADGSLEREVSSVPLRALDGAGRERPVSLELAQIGAAFTPANPLHRLSISERLGGGVAVGSESVRFIPLGADVRGQLVGVNSVFYPSVGTDEDVSVAPTVGGVELSTVLRSRLSPEQIGYQVVLPAGAVMRSSGAGAVISSGSSVVRVLAPTARDAQGQSVPVQMTVNGDRLVLHVAHRERDVAYPLLVDPSVTEEHCCGEWEFKGVKWEPSFIDKEAEEEFVNSEPGVLEAKPGGYLDQERHEVAQEWENVWAEENGWLNTKITFFGVEFSEAGDSGGVIEGRIEGVCQGGKSSQTYEWNNVENGAPPSTLTFPSREEYAKDEFKFCEPDGFAIGLATDGKAPLPLPEGCHEVFDVVCTVTSNVRLAVSGVLVISRSEKAAKHHRKKGIRHREVLGKNNPGEPNQYRVCEGKPVDCATGNETETQTDLNVPGLGVPLAFTRTYNSQAAVTQSTAGQFGYGWSASFGDHIALNGEAETETVEQANGSVVVFKGNYHVAGELTPPPWAQAKLIVESDGSFLYTLPNQQAFHFSFTGRLLSESDRNGNTTTVNHSGERITTVSDPSGRTITFKYNTEGQVESVTDPLGHVVKYAYEGGNLVSVTEPGEMGPRWQFKYDSSHELTEMIDGRSGKTLNEYNGAHQVVLQTDPMGRVSQFEYEEIKSELPGEYVLPSLSQETPEEEVQEEETPEEISGGILITPAPETVTKVTHTGTGAVTFEHFNNEGEVQYITKAYGTSSANTAKFTYTATGALASVTDGNEHTTKYGYDSEGNRTEQIDPNSNITKWGYDTTHDVTSTTTPSGEKTTIKRNSHGNPETIERPAPSEKIQTTKYKYAANGELESVTDPLERTWKYGYDTYGDRTSEIDPVANKRTWEYNKDSQEIATVSPRGYSTLEELKYTTKIERDMQGRQLTITDPLSHTTKYTYDGDGNVETLTDPNGNKTKYVYDADNELTKVEEPNGTITETGYDATGQITSQTDGNKHVTKYVRNPLEQITEVIDPRGRKTTKEYDKAGNLKTLTDPALRTATYTYDPANRLTGINYSDGKTHAVEYEYNKDGRVTVMKDGTGISKYTYDQLDRLTETENGHKETVKYEYDIANQQTKITYPNGKAVTRTYDKDGRLEKVTDWLEHTTKFAYDPDSDPSTTTFPTGTTNEDKYTYNQADQMSEVKMTKSAETLASLVYTRDNNGQVKTITSKNLPGEEKPSYEYDSNNRLTKAGTTAYEYDAANNPTKLATSTYKYDSANELETGPSLKYTYDELGERTKTIPTTGPATTYTDDQAGNLTSIERPKEGATPEIKDTYTYDGNDLRASQTISATTTYLAWNTSEPLPLLLNDGTNNYIYGPNGLPIEQINNTTSTVLYLHHDQQGSTRLLTSSTGVKEATFTYDAYGNTTGTTGTATTPLHYDGQYTSSDTGLIYLRARAYDPATAQFLSVDPITALTRAPYTYASSNPINEADPTGLGNWLDLGIPSPGEAAAEVLGPLNPVQYYEEEITDYENGCGYLASVTHGIEGAAVGVTDLIPGESTELRVSSWLQSKFPWLTGKATNWIARDNAAKVGQPGWTTIIKTALEHIAHLR